MYLSDGTVALAMNFQNNLRLGFRENGSWQFVDVEPKQNKFRKMSDVPATSPESDALSKDLKKRGFKFVGSTIMYAHMQATGLVNDHVVTCFRHKECRALAKR